MNISFPRSHSTFYVSSELLIAAHSDNASWSRHFHAQVQLVHDCFEFVDEPPAEDGEVGIVHFDNVESDVFCSWVSGVTEGDWEWDFAESFDLFPSEPN